MSITTFSRVAAAEILRKIADDGEIGMPLSVDLNEVGRALHRICSNDPTPDPIAHILHGWFERERE